MALRWLRGCANNQPVGGQSQANGSANTLLWRYFLVKILGWIQIDEVSTSGGGSWECHEHTGTTGSFTGSSLRFTVTGSPFVSGDVGKFICIIHDVYSGIYEITGYVDANNVDLDFYAPGGVYPGAGTGLTWWLINDGAGPTGFLDYFVLRSPHATHPCLLQVRNRWGSGSGNTWNNGPSFFLCPTRYNASLEEWWNTSTHAWRDGAPVPTREMQVSGSYGYTDTAGKLFGCGNTDGSGFTLWAVGTTVNKWTRVGGVYLIEPFESTPTWPDEQRWVAMGPLVGYDCQTHMVRGISSEGTTFGKGASFVKNRWKTGMIHMQGWWDQAQDFFRRSFGGPNSWSGSYDLVPMWLMGDADGAVNLLPTLWGTLPTSLINVGAAYGLGRNMAFDSHSYVHLTDSICVPGPGFSGTWQ